jgi:hypothetical protein
VILNFSGLQFVIACLLAGSVPNLLSVFAVESICFAILIGISVDFVIHFSHAYASLPGVVSKERRTKHALIYMGPSILAAAFTTLAAALIMLFCVILFFTKFATVLFFTIVQSLVGSFVVFLTITDCIGPTAPTHWFDECVARTEGKPEVNEENKQSEKAAAEEKNPQDDVGMQVENSLYDEEISV